MTIKLLVRKKCCEIQSVKISVVEKKLWEQVDLETVILVVDNSGFIYCVQSTEYWRVGKDEY